MAIDIIAVQITLGILLFFISNWIGKHSYSVGYMSISMFIRTDEAPAFNYIIVVLTPLVYLIIVATGLYGLGLDKYTTNFYLVNVYYLAFRLLFNLLTGKALLLNWGRQFLYWLSILSLSYLIYIKLIINKKNILPDFTTVANEVWIIILVFLFQVLNRVELPHEGTAKRKNNYLSKAFNKYKEQYGSIVESRFTSKKLQALSYAILIYENFNRPKLVRLAENIKFRLTKKPHTLGIMQVQTDALIDDNESVKRGTLKILKSYSKHRNQFLDGLKSEFYITHHLINDIISDYNSGYEYQSGVRELFEMIEGSFYPDNKEELIDDSSNPHI